MPCFFPGTTDHDAKSAKMTDIKFEL